MEELERPKRRALSDAELASELAKFPSDNTGIERAQALIATQQKLREEDAAALEQWFERMRRQDDALARGLIRETLDELFPTSPEQQPAQIKPEPAFTSEIQVVSRRRVISQRIKLAQFGAGFNRALMLALISLGVASWLEVTGLDLLIAYLLGGGLALLGSFALRSHDLHPLLRSAAVFGGRGVYWFAPLMLSGLGLMLLVALDDDSDIGMIELGFGYQALAVVLAGAVMILTQLIPSRFHAIAFGALGLAVFGEALRASSLSQDFAYQGNWLWAAIAIAVLGFLLLTFGMPHLRTNTGTDAGAWVLGAGFVAVISLLVFAQDSQIQTLLIAVLIFALSASARDIAGGVRSRVLGLAVLVVAAAMIPLGDLLSTNVVAIVVAASILLLSDQFTRRQPLHLASLDTSYGFYGSWQLSSWSALVLSAILGSSFIISLLPVELTRTEWALVMGALVGLLFAAIRVPIVGRQDKELENIDPRNSRLENLLGL